MRASNISLNGSLFLQLQSKNMNFQVKEAMQDNDIFNGEDVKLKTIPNLKQCTCHYCTLMHRPRIATQTGGQKVFFA